MFRVTVDQYILQCQSDAIPPLLDDYSQHALLVELIDLDNSDGTACFVSVGKPNQWPFLVVALRYMPGPESGFYPGALVIPETDVLFIGAGERILAYSLAGPTKIWEDTADTGFWSWSRHGDIVIMSAELECAAWDTRARKLWSTFVEPPWEYSVSADTLCLDVMGKKSSFHIRKGP